MDDRERRKKERRNKVLTLLPPVVGVLFILLAIAGGTMVARRIDRPVATPEPTSKVTVIPARTPGPSVRPEISSMRLVVYGEALGPDGFTAYVGDKITLTAEITPQFINPPVIWSYSDPSSVNLKPGDDRLTCVFTALKPTGKNELSVKCYDIEIVIPVYLWER